MTDVLRINGLNICVHTGNGKQKVVENLTLSIKRGETLALVGESGSGKSMTANAVMGLLPPALTIDGGEILFRGEDMVPWPEKRKRHIRGSQIGYVMQDYQGSFTPFIRIGKQCIETLRSHRKISSQEATKLILQWFDRVGLPAERTFHSYPFQLSGGQRQRASLACTMMLEPDLLIADEVTTALDVLTGERVMELMSDLQRQSGCAMLLITHDLRLALKRAATVAVMKAGSIVEMGSADLIRSQARHPYTKQLLAARPSLAEMNIANEKKPQAVGSEADTA